MDVKITAALISAAATLIGVMLSWLLSNLKYSSASNGKGRLLDGSWRGTTSQTSGPQGTAIEVDLVLELKTSWRKISGTCRVKGGGDELNVELSGGYRDLEHVFFAYNSKNKNKVNFGYILLKLNGNSDTLNGKMIGYGNMSQGLVMGNIALTKIKH